MLLAWPIITLVLILRKPMPLAILVSLIGGYLLLPTQGGIDLPILPAFNKLTIPPLTLLVLGVLMYRQHSSTHSKRSREQDLDLPGWLPGLLSIQIGLVIIFIGAQLTALTNGDVLRYGATVLPALRVYDGFSLALMSFTMFVPLVLGRKFFAHPDRHLLLLRGCLIAAFAMSFLALFEIRMSPQLNNIVYGYFPHSWQQHIRSGGYRPLIFMQHGLQLAIFFAGSIIAAFGLYRAEKNSKRRRLYLLAGLWILGTLFLSNSLGAFVIVLVLVPVVLMFKVRTQVIISAVLAGTVLLYPMLRNSGVIPLDQLVSTAASIDEDRAASLRFRFINEDQILARANERPFFGWGPFSRARIFTSYGEDVTTLDGAWVAVIGESGWVGYLTTFGFLALPVIFVAFYHASIQLRPETATLCAMMAAALIDLIPNGFFSPVTFLIAGALWGRLEIEKKGLLAGSQAEINEDIHKTDTPQTLGSQNQSIYTRQIERHPR